MAGATGPAQWKRIEKPPVMEGPPQMYWKCPCCGHLELNSHELCVRCGTRKPPLDGGLVAPAAAPARFTPPPGRVPAAAAAAAAGAGACAGAVGGPVQAGPVGKEPVGAGVGATAPASGAAAAAIDAAGADAMAEAEKRLEANGRNHDGWVEIARLKDKYGFSDHVELGLKLLEPSKLSQLVGNNLGWRLAEVEDKDATLRKLIADTDPAVEHLLRRLDEKDEQRRRRAEVDRAVAAGREAARLAARRAEAPPGREAEADRASDAGREARVLGQALRQAARRDSGAGFVAEEPRLSRAAAPAIGAPAIGAPAGGERARGDRAGGARPERAASRSRSRGAGPRLPRGAALQGPNAVPLGPPPLVAPRPRGPPAPAFAAVAAAASAGPPGEGQAEKMMSKAGIAAHLAARDGGPAPGGAPSGGAASGARPPPPGKSATPLPVWEVQRPRGPAPVAGRPVLVQVVPQKLNAATKIEGVAKAKGAGRAREEAVLAAAVAAPPSKMIRPKAGSLAGAGGTAAGRGAPLQVGGGAAAASAAPRAAATGAGGAAEGGTAAGGAAAKPAEVELAALLAGVNLASFVAPLARLGVETRADLRYVTEEDLEGMSMTVIQRRKFKELADAAGGAAAAGGGGGGGSRGGGKAGCKSGSKGGGRVGGGASRAGAAPIGASPANGEGSWRRGSGKGGGKRGR